MYPCQFLSCCHQSGYIHILVIPFLLDRWDYIVLHSTIYRCTKDKKHSQKQTNGFYVKFYSSSMVPFSQNMTFIRPVLLAGTVHPLGVYVICFIIEITVLTINT